VCFVLFAVSDEAKTWLPFFFFRSMCIIKQLLDSVFVIYISVIKNYKIIRLEYAHKVALK